MAQNKVKTLKVLETASLWCAIASLLVFFANLIAFISILVVGAAKGDSFDWNGTIYKLTVVTENISLVAILAWIVMAIIEMVIITKNKELKKYHYGSFAAWIIAMIISLGFLFLSLLIFFIGASNGWNSVVYITFVLYIAATAGSIMYIASVSRSLRRIKYGN